MKKIILPVFFLLLSSVSHAGDSLEMSTILKPPINTFDRLQLIRQTTFNSKNCIDGTVFLNASNDLTVCYNKTLKSINSPWVQNGNIIYLQDWNNSAVKVGVGTTTPDQKFEVSNPDNFNSIQVNTLDSEQNLGINLITRGVPTLAGGNWAAFINFNTPTTSGRIIYADRRPWGRSGLGIASAAVNISDPNNIYDIWMDAENGNVGLGVGAVAATQATDFDRPPAQQLEVKNGNLKANTVYLTQPDGSNTAELKTTYIAGRGYYYAVLAP